LGGLPDLVRAIPEPQNSMLHVFQPDEDHRPKRKLL
jgi:hypothetical protein